MVVAPSLRPRSGRLLILVVLVVVAVVVPAGAALLGRAQPATRLEPLPAPSSASTAAQTYPPGTPAPPLRLQTLDGARRVPAMRADQKERNQAEALVGANPSA